MSKLKSTFYCQNCGAKQPRWIGHCPDCDQWNTFVEEVEETGQPRTPLTTVQNSGLIPITEIASDGGHHIPTGIKELDRVLGNGYIPGGVVLIGGDPGIGKSTIVMQALNQLACKNVPVLYISGEESASQIKLRADRMSIASKNLGVLIENSVEKISDYIKEQKHAVIVIDSIQTMYTTALQSAPGSVGQVRESAARLITHAKANDVSLFLVGHVTKDGSIAGPKVLEHMVDTVLYFEGERGHSFRILRSIKNRFGPANEIGVFEMTGEGLKEVANPSGIFLAEKPKHVAGSVVSASLEGQRPLLIELQSLVSPSGFGTPRRTALGVDVNRIALIVAVLEKTMGLEFRTQDVFFNIVGGLKFNEPALDLASALAIYSSHKNKPIDHETVVIGEIGLAGEIRTVIGLDTRLKEAEKMGFRRAIVPRTNLKAKIASKMEVFGVLDIRETISMI